VKLFWFPKVVRARPRPPNVGPFSREVTVAITLIVTKSLNEDFQETGERIAMDQWLDIVEADPALTLRTQPHVTRLPDGQELTMPARPGQSELTVTGGDRVPFLGYRQGELVMRLTEDMEDANDPKRQKVAEVARKLGALITHDAGDEILKW